MDLLEQCKNWNDEGEYGKVVDALEILPDNARTPELDSELARAYNNLGEPGDHELFFQALELLKPHKDYFKGDHKFYFRMAFSYFYIDEEGPALHYFRKALDARPGDEDTYDMMSACVDYLTNPRFDFDFSERVKIMWNHILKEIEASNTKEDNSKNVADIISEGILKAFPKKSLEFFEKDGKGFLELAAGEDKSDIFMSEYIKDMAPEKIRNLVEISVGLSSREIPEGNIEYEGESYDISGLRFYVTDERQIIIYEKAKSYIQKEVLQELFVSIFGEIALMTNDFQVEIIREEEFDTLKYEISDVNVKAMNKKDFLNECVDYRELKETCAKKGFRVLISAAEYLKMYSGYQLQPEESEGIREDIYTGSTCLPSLISEYIASGSFDITPIMDELHRNGIMAGYFCFSLKKDESWDAMDYEFEIVKLRDELIKHIKTYMAELGRSADITFIEGATGSRYGYLDFLLFGGMQEVMDSAYDFFKSKNLPFAAFKTFRKISRPVGFIAEE